MELPNLYDLVFDTRKRQFDQARWSLLEWILDLNDGTVKKVQRQENYQRYAAVVITLLYLVKVCNLLYGHLKGNSRESSRRVMPKIHWGYRRKMEAGSAEKPKQI